MKQLYILCLLLLCIFFSFSGNANTRTVNAEINNANAMISVEHAYVRASIPGTSHSSSYMDIENTGDEPVSLVSASSKVSERIEIHQHSMIDGMMRMRKVESITIEPKERVKLQPSGLHLMIFDVKKPLKSQQEVEITLYFSNNISVTMQVPVYNPIQEKAALKTMPTSHEHHH